MTVLHKIPAQQRRKIVDQLVEEQPEQLSEPSSEQDRVWYVNILAFFVLIVAYLCLAIGWLLQHIGDSVFWLGEQMKTAAREID